MAFDLVLNLVSQEENKENERDRGECLVVHDSRPRLLSECESGTVEERGVCLVFVCAITFTCTSTD